MAILCPNRFVDTPFLRNRTLAAGVFLLTFMSIAFTFSVTPIAAPLGLQKNNATNKLASECVRSSANNYDECLQPVQPPLDSSALHLSREERTLYSAFNQTSLSPEMKSKLDALAELLTSEHNVTGVRIIGYADRMGDPILNEKLSKERAENVQRYLINKGITKARVADTRWLGSRLPATDCPDSLGHSQLIHCLQQDRRVEIEIDYQSDKQAVVQNLVDP